MPLLLRLGACFACVAIIVDHKQRTARSVVGWDEQNKNKINQNLELAGAQMKT